MCVRVLFLLLYFSRHTCKSDELIYIPSKSNNLFVNTLNKREKKLNELINYSMKKYISNNNKCKKNANCTALFSWNGQQTFELITNLQSHWLFINLETFYSWQLCECTNVVHAKIRQIDHRATDALSHTPHIHSLLLSLSLPRAQSHNVDIFSFNIQSFRFSFPSFALFCEFVLIAPV